MRKLFNFKLFASSLLFFLLLSKMQALDIPFKDIVLIGGGHSHVHVIKMMGMKPIKGVRVTLISRDIETPYSGMVPAYVAGHYSREECHIDLNVLCSFAKVRLFHTEVESIDTKLKTIKCKDGRPDVRYNVLSINTGIVPKPLPSVFGTEAPITAVKPIDKFAARWENILTKITTTTITDPVRLAIVGGGAGGTELAFAMLYRLQKHMNESSLDPSLIKVSLYNRGNTIMSGHNPIVQDLVAKILVEKGIDFHKGAEINNVIERKDTKGEKPQWFLVSTKGEEYPFDEAFWCTQAVAPSWIKDLTDLECHTDGCICVKSTLESVNVKDVFAVGDVCHNVNNPRPKAGVFAVRAGPPLLANLRRKVLGIEPLEEWEPQSQFLGLIGTGDEAAVASKGGIGIYGDYLWKLKDQIDQQWMDGYRMHGLPTMEQMEAEKIRKKEKGEEEEVLSVVESLGIDASDLIEKAKMRCGGCGSKVGAQILTRALNRVKSLYTKAGGDIGENLINTDDAAVVAPPESPRLLLQTIDYFRSFISDPYVTGKIAAIHSLSDIHAMNGRPESAMALCILPFGVEQKTEDTLTELLAGCSSALRAEGCSLVGGHTSEGTELAIGLSCTGSVHAQEILRKGPPKVGQVIVLTQAIGTGVILAADMRAKAKGRWVQAAIKGMLQSNGQAAKLIYHYGGTEGKKEVCCTDVTGFGLLGHLLEMLKYGQDEENSVERVNGGEKGVTAELFLNQIPFFPGAKDCVKNGISSSLQPQNARSARAVSVGNLEKGSDLEASYTLLFDPQTSGGLLATVDEKKANELIIALKESGYIDSRIIGKIVERTENDVEQLKYVHVVEN